MSDNIPKDLCERQMNAYLDIPTEVWTDIFKLLPRKTLVKCVQPVNKVFKAICDKNVKSVHVIGDINNIGHFMRNFEALEGSNCALAGHFRMSNIKIDCNSRNEVRYYQHHTGRMSFFRIKYEGRNETNLAFLRHSLDLLRHCQLIISPRTHGSLKKLAKQILVYLTVLEPAKPIYIEMELKPTQPDEYFQWKVVDLGEILHHPTTLNCSRLQLFGNYMAMTTDNRQAMFNWLHHRVHGEEMRCLVLHRNEPEDLEWLVEQCVQRCLILHRNEHEALESLVEQCVQNFEQSKVPEDRRCFVLAFHSPFFLDHTSDALANFERKNPATGEVLKLDRVVNANGRVIFRLLRCMASQVVDNGKEQLYTELFKANYEFKLDGDEQQLAKVKISGKVE